MRTLFDFVVLVVRLRFPLQGRNSQSLQPPKIEQSSLFPRIPNDETCFVWQRIGLRQALGTGPAVVPASSILGIEEFPLAARSSDITAVTAGTWHPSGGLFGHEFLSEFLEGFDLRSAGQGIGFNQTPGTRLTVIPRRGISRLNEPPIAVGTGFLAAVTTGLGVPALLR